MLHTSTLKLSVGAAHIGGGVNSLGSAPQWARAIDVGRSSESEK